MIDIRHIHFCYHPSRPVLHDVGGRIRPGDFAAIVGPNGSGKSTLIKCLCGILKPQRGSILINGLPVAKYPPVRLARTVAYIPQTEKSYRPITVFDAVLTGRTPYIRWKPSGQDFDEVAGVLRKLGIARLSMRYVHELSGGQQQTVMIARALAQKTRILLLDEPTANLDMRHQQEVMELLKSLSARGLTIVMSIHDINTAIRYTGRLMMLKEGRLFAGGGREIVTRENMEQLYDIRVEMLDVHGTPHVIPHSVQFRSDEI
ncbi:MAG: ABC transporter ATP-binding protein [Tannerella sp.]|jgi:iron complex transport system ATP-binding protein|nr:ABC transporter ATP-binding protein [Tannerella sp.]